MFCNKQSTYGGALVVMMCLVGFIARGDSSSLLEFDTPWVSHGGFSNDARLEDIFEGPNLDDEFLIDGFLDSIPLDLNPGKRKIDPINLFDLLKSVNVSLSLDADFYKRTNPFVVRSLLDYPIFEIHRCAIQDGWVIGGHLFWNHTNRSVFDGKSTSICSYLNLDFTPFIDQLKDLIKDPKFASTSIAIQLASILKMTDFDDIFALINEFTVEQRRTGFMFQTWRQWHRGEMRFLIPIYYLERNIFTDPDKQSALESQFLSLGLTPDEEQQNRFEKYHAICDKIGLGDLRFEADYAAYKTDTTAIRLGIMSTLPTNVAFIKGIRGTSFDTVKKCDSCDNAPTSTLVTSTPCMSTALPQPILDLQADLLDYLTISGGTITVTDQEKVRAALIGDLCRNTGFLLGALDRLNAILLESPLGNYRHVGIGPLIRIQTLLSAFLEEYEWAWRISWSSRLSAEYQTPAQETRFFVRRNNATDFSTRDFASDDPAVAAANLVFLADELVNQFYPYAFKVRVQPGVILHSTSRFCFSGTVWDLNLGSDFWMQTKEKFMNLENSIPASLLSRLDVPVAQTGLAYQGKIFGGIGFKIDHPTHRWLIGLNAEITTWSKWIGKDWTASLNVEANF